MAKAKVKLNKAAIREQILKGAETKALIKKYGGVAIAVTLDENGIPKKAEDRFKIGDASQILFKKKTSLVRNIRVQKTDGEFVWAKVSSVPIINDGNMISIMLSY